jgi:formate hydrogenlyase transcriptional activator
MPRPEKLTKATKLKKSDTVNFDAIEKQIQSFELEKSTLLMLSDDITKVREKTDLITLFQSRLKSLFYFNHTIVMLIDKTKGTYAPFLLDPEHTLIKNHPDYQELIRTIFQIDTPFIQQIINADSPLHFQMEALMEVAEIPSFIRMNYEYGIKEIMITPLKSKMETIGFVLLYTDKAGNFNPQFKAILKGIAPQLSSAVSNIITNDEIRNNESINETLLSISNAMVSVRNRNDLLSIINTGLKELIDFTHNEMTVLDEGGVTYHILSTTPETNKNSKYAEAISIPYSVEDSIYSDVTNTDETYIFNLRSLNLNDAPNWLKLNYTAGSREMLIKVLPHTGTARHKLLLFSDKLNVFNQQSLNIINSISGQLGTAINNITVNEEILKKEQDTSSLLKLSSNIAAVRTKEDLELAIVNVLENIMHIKLAMIRTLDDDHIGLSAYMFDKSMFQDAAEAFNKLSSTKITIHEPLSARVLKSREPLIFNIEKEERNGNTGAYLQLWKKVGRKNAYGAPLRVGDKIAGTLWLLTDDLNLVVLKGICAQIAVAISNIKTNDKLSQYKQRLEIENDHLKEEINTIYNFNEIVGQGQEMQKVYGLMKKVAESNSTVLLLGETGTGKELIARSIHNASQRKNKVMIKVNCAALPANLIESELFGHEKGAFTGATDRRIGKFELANNSTLFLDEIGELPLELQVKLLRVIQEREFERVGGSATIKIDVRLVAATNRNLETEVDNGRFRSDLFYRLNVFPINLPSLCERQEDIIPLANYFLTRYGKLTGMKVNSFSPRVIEELQAYQWPGNVRELEHLVERSVLLSSDSVIRDIDLPKITGDDTAHIEIPLHKTLEDMERDYIVEVLTRCSGKIAGAGGAAELLDIPSTTLHSKMKKLNIAKSDSGDEIV